MSQEPPLFLTVHVRPRPDTAAAARALLERMIAASRLEQGCELMEFVEAQDDPLDWLVFERWSSRPLWEVHAGTDRNHADGAELGALLEAPLALRFFRGAGGPDAVG